MGSSSDLAARLDFDRGLEFQDGIHQRLKSPVHHPFPSPDGSFFLLVTFRRFLFRLTEDSVGISLQSCLGDRASDFHVQFLSTNHFCFSLFSKSVGFEIYMLVLISSNSAQRSSRALIQCPDRGRPTKPWLVDPIAQHYLEGGGGQGVFKRFMMISTYCSNPTDQGSVEAVGSATTAAPHLQHRCRCHYNSYNDVRGLGQDSL